MIRTVLAAIALALTTACSTAPPAQMPSMLQVYLNGVDGFSGSVLVADGEDVTFSRSYGFADAAAERPIEDSDIWRWASVTKQIVAVLILQEVERGAFELDSTLAERLPGFETDHADEITVKMLLQHTSGLPNPERLGRLDFRNFQPDVFCSGAPEAAPLARFSYNNCDYYVLGQILEASTGQSWDTLLRDRILRPLNMRQTAAMNSDLSQTVLGYASDGVLAEEIDLTLFDAAGAIFGDPRDLIKFNHGLMSGALLSDESLARLWDGDPSLGFVALGAWSFQAPLGTCATPVKIIERRGYIEGIQARNFLFPETGQSVVIFVNRGDFEFGEIWMGQGFSYEVLSLAVACPPA